MRSFLEISPEVKKAIENNEAVVALESTIIAHGMPYPQNMETALAVEKIVRDGGAIPATIAIINGKLKAGLNKKEIEILAKGGSDIMKCSRRDIPYLLAKKMTGATTVASTMIIAEQAGIRIFATGGIGGVHRGANETMDISADLQELANTNVAVICAGAKAILDLGLTLEYLETYGVPVLGYQTKELPSFYTSKSGFFLDHKIDTVNELAKVLYAKWTVGLDGGVVIANPIPIEYELDATKMKIAIDQAIEEAKEKGIRGKESTPFLLSRVKELTDGESLDSNIQLVYNNVRLATKLAIAFMEINFRD